MNPKRRRTVFTLRRTEALGLLVPQICSPVLAEDAANTKINIPKERQTHNNSAWLEVEHTKKRVAREAAVTQTHSVRQRERRQEIKPGDAHGGLSAAGNLNMWLEKRGSVRLSHATQRSTALITYL